MMSGHDWVFDLPAGHELERVHWRGDAPPRILTRTPDGALVVYAPKPGSRRVFAMPRRAEMVFSPTD